MPAPTKNTGIAGSRAKSTTQLSQATATPSLPPPVHPSLSGFNPSNSRFGAINAGLGASEKLRIWDVENSVVLGEWDIVPEAGKTNQKVRCLAWGSFFAEDLHTSTSDGENRKKRRKRRSEGASSAPRVDAVVLAQGNNLLFYTANSNTVVKNVPVSSPVTALGWTSQEDGLLIAATADHILFFDASANPLFTADLPATVKTAALTAISALPSSSSTLSVILASNSIVKLDVSSPISESSTATFGTPQQVGVEPIRKMVALNAQQFVVGEEQARVASIWRATESSSAPFEMVASVPIPTLSNVHTLTVSPEHTELLVLAESGEITVYSVSEAALASHSTSDPSAGKKAAGRRRKTGAIPSLQPVSKISVVEGKESRQAGLISLAVLPSSSETQDGMDVEVDGQSDKSSQVVIGRMGGASRVKWEKIVSRMPLGRVVAHSMSQSFRDAAGAILPEITVKRSVQDIAGSDADGVSWQSMCRVVD